MTLKITHFKDELCTITFVENGAEYHQKGKVVDMDDNFIYLQTLSNFFAINLKNVIKIKTAIEGGQP